MFGIGGQELVLILLLALIVLGPKKLPELAKTIGKALGEFQRATDDLKKEIDVASREKPAGPKPAPVPEEEPAQAKADQEPAAEKTTPLEQEDVSSEVGESPAEEDKTRDKTGGDPVAYRPGEIEG